MARVALDPDLDEHGQAEADALAVEHRAVAGDDPGALERAHAAQARRGREVQALGERGVRDPALALQDSSIRRSTVSRGRSVSVAVVMRRLLLNTGRSGAKFAGSALGSCATMLRGRARSPPARRTALYVGAVLGPGVLLVPSLAAEAAGPASVIAWGALLALSVPLALTFAALGVRPPRRAGRPPTPAPRSARAPGAVTGWWFLAGVLHRRARASRSSAASTSPTSLGAGREAAVASRRRSSSWCVAANAAGLRDDGAAPARAGRRARARSSLVAIVDRAAREPRGQLDAVRAARLVGRRHRGQPADVLVHRLGGGLAPRRRAARPAAAAPARDLRRAGDRRGALPRAGRRTVGVLGTAAPTAMPLADLMAAGLGAPGRTGDRAAGRAAHDGDDERLRRRGGEARRRAGTRARPAPRAPPAVALALSRHVGGAARPARGGRARRRDLSAPRAPPSSPSTPRRRRPACGCSRAARAGPRASRSPRCWSSSRSPARSSSCRRRSARRPGRDRRPAARSPAPAPCPAASAL